MSLKNFGLLLALASIWGVSFIFFRTATPVFGEAWLIELRLLTGAIFLFGFVWLFRIQTQWRKNWRFYLILGATNSAIPFLLFAYASHSLTAALLAICNATTPIFAALLGAVWLRTPLTKTAMLGLALGLAGVAIIGGGGEWVKAEGAGLAMAGVLFAAFLYAVAGLYVKANNFGDDAYGNALGSVAAAALLVVPLTLVIPLRAAPLPLDWATALTFGILCTGIAYLLYYKLLKNVGPMKAMTVTFLTPGFAALWGYVFLQEPLEWRELYGALLIFAGTALANGLLKLPKPRAAAK